MPCSCVSSRTAQEEPSLGCPTVPQEVADDLCGSGQQLHQKQPVMAVCLNLAGPWYPNGWSSIILDAPVRVFLDESNIFIGWLSKADCPPKCGCASSN